MDFAHFLFKYVQNFNVFDLIVRIASLYHLSMVLWNPENSQYMKGFIQNNHCSKLRLYSVRSSGRPHQIQVSGSPEHPTNPPGLPKITEWEPKGKNLEKFSKIGTLFHRNISPMLLGFVFYKCKLISEHLLNKLSFAVKFKMLSVWS